MRRLLPFVLAACSPASRPEAACPAAAASVSAAAVVPSATAQVLPTAPPRGVPAPPVATATTPPPPQDRPKEREPIVLPLGGERALRITFKRPGLAVGPTHVAEISIAGVVLFPSTCQGRGDGLCSPAHRALRSDDGKGATQVFLDHDEGEDEATLFFAAITPGSPECGAYGHWALRATKTAVLVTPPIVGCFRTPTPGGGEDPPFPHLTWGKPPILVLKPEGRPETQVLVLRNAPFAWERILGKP